MAVIVGFLIFLLIAAGDSLLDNGEPHHDAERTPRGFPGLFATADGYQTYKVIN